VVFSEAKFFVAKKSLQNFIAMTAPWPRNFAPLYYFFINWNKKQKIIKTK